MITADAGAVGLIGNEGDIATAGILAFTALALLNFWRNIWISWTKPSAALKNDSAGNVSVAKEKMKWGGIFGFVLMLILLALFKGCGKEIAKAIL